MPNSEHGDRLHRVKVHVCYLHTYGKMRMRDTFKSAAKIVGGPLFGLIIDGVEKASKSIDMASDEGLGLLREEVAKQRIKMDFSQHQARIAQELAIAKRIENAAEVEIEEFYDYSGKGSAGLTVNAESQTGSLGFSDENRRVSKRIYRFKSAAALIEESYVQSEESPK